MLRVIIVIAIIIPLVLLAQQMRTAKKSADETCTMPCGTVTGVQVTSVPDSEGGGDLVYLRFEDGLIGPFQKLPSLPTGVGYGSTEVSVPAAPTSPCKRGEWAKEERFLYMCVSLDVAAGGAGSTWKRVPFDRSWTADNATSGRVGR